MILINIMSFLCDIIILNIIILIKFKKKILYDHIIRIVGIKSIYYVKV